MSLEQALRFYHKVQTESDFYTQLEQYLQQKPTEQQELGLYEFAQQHGYTFSLDEYKTLLALQPQADSLSSNAPRLTVNKLERAFIALSGSSPRILASCPESEQKKHAALGGAVLVPAFLALLTVSFFLYTLNFSSYTIVLVALVWAGIILLMDRALLATYRKGLSSWGKAGQFALRFGIAFLIAVTVAHPVVLLLFSERIEAAYNEGRIKTERNNLALQCDSKNPHSDVRLLDEKISTLRSQFSESERLLEPAVCSSNASLASLPEAPLLEKFNQDLENLRSKQQQADQDVALFIDNAEKEKQGIGSNGFTGVRGCKKDSQCKRWLRQASARKDDSLRLGKEIVSLQKQITKLNEKITNQFLESKDLASKQCDREREELKTTRAQQHDLDQKSLAALHEQRVQLQSRCAEKEAVITHLKPDILTQTEILMQLIYPGQHIAWHNLSLFLTFMLLFLAVDMLAVVLKMSPLGVYETKVEIAESHNQMLAFIQARHQLLQQFTQLATQEQQTIAQTKMQNLQHALQDSFAALLQAYVQAERAKLAAFFRK